MTGTKRDDKFICLFCKLFLIHATNSECLKIRFYNSPHTHRVRQNRNSCRGFAQRSETWHWGQTVTFLPVSAARDRATNNQAQEGISAPRVGHQSGYKAGAPMRVLESVCADVWWGIVCGCTTVLSLSLSPFLPISPPPLPLSPLPAAHW